jgi:hypothetical protein
LQSSSPQHNPLITCAFYFCDNILIAEASLEKEILFTNYII